MDDGDDDVTAAALAADLAALGGPDAVAVVLRDLAADARRRLVALGEDLGGVVDAARDANGDDEHDPEGATIAFERSQIDAAVRRSRLSLDEATAALDRLTAGGYGRCAVCGRPIGAARLAARPTARTCRTCAR